MSFTDPNKGATAVAGDRSILEHLPTSQRTTREQAAARSVLVQRLRIALPVVAGLLIVAFYFNAQPNQADSTFLKDFENLEAAPEELEMANPRFAGVDGAGKPYEITAQRATRTPTEDQVVSLDQPRAVTQGPKEKTVVVANEGFYRSETKVLELRDDVTLEHAIGVDNYVFRAPAATVFLDQERVVSDAGVKGFGPSGNTLSADQMEAFQDENRIVFTGNVKLKIHQSEGIGAPPTLRFGATGADDTTQETPQ